MNVGKLIFNPVFHFEFAISTVIKISSQCGVHLVFFWRLPFKKIHYRATKIVLIVKL